MLFAFFGARMAGEGDEKVLLISGGIIAGAALAIWLRTRLWVLIVLCLTVQGIIPAIKIPLRVLDFAILFATVSYLIFIAVRVLRVRVEKDILDLLLLVNLAYLGSVFYRNPVGLHSLGSGMVGGRPYFYILMAFFAYHVLKRAPASKADVLRLPLYITLGAAFSAFCGIVATYKPNVGAALTPFYSGFQSFESADALATADLDSRQITLSAIGNSGILYLVSRYAPVTLFLPIYPMRLFAFLTCTVANLLSGFRTALISSFIYMLMSTWLRKRFHDMFILVGLVTVLVLFCVVGNNRMFRLPTPAQRALSFLPGDWDAAALDDANYSTQWRIEMWKMVLTEDRWIKDKWLGDGFGFSESDLALMKSAREGGQGFIGGSAQEGWMIAGGFHNGPLSAMRYVGALGLLIFIPLQFYLAVRYYRLIKVTRGTPHFCPALFTGMPVVYGVFNFYFLVGSFDAALPETLLAAGILRLVERNFANSTAVEKVATAVLEKKKWTPGRTRIRRPVPTLGGV